MDAGKAVSQAPPPRDLPAPRWPREVVRLVPLAVLCAAPLVAGKPFWLHLAILVCLNAIFAGSLGIIARVGQLSLCHGAFAGIGAYAAVLSVMRAGFPFLAGVALAVVAAGLLAAALGSIILRLRGVYFVLVTFAFGELVRLVLLDFPSVSGGANGVTGIPPARILGHEIRGQAGFYVFALVSALAVLAFTIALLRSPVGRAFDAIAENLALAEGSGIGARRFQVVAFAIGSAIAGGGGALLAHYVGYVSPETFSFALSLNVIIMLVVGGRRSVVGPLLGALVLTPLPELLRETLALQHILYGAALILVLRFLPEGLGGLADRLWVRLGGGRSP